MTHYVTPFEVRVIVRAAGQATVEIPVWSDADTESAMVQFCGYCGRVVCHPECERRTAA